MSSVALIAFPLNKYIHKSCKILYYIIFGVKTCVHNVAEWHSIPVARYALNFMHFVFNEILDTPMPLPKNGT